LVILGSGTSFGVPVIGCDCPVCTSPDPKDRRTRTAAVVEEGGTRVLIDTPPELRLQLVHAGIGAVDAVLYTHDHADHIHGIDDLRAMSVRRGRIPIYGPAETIEGLERRFAYIFDHRVQAAPGTSKPELVAAPVEPDQEFQVAGVAVLPLECDHGGSRVFGYRIGPAAYLTDVKQAPPRTMERLRGVEVLVVNALFDRPHPSHLSIPEAVELARAVGARRAYLTHLTHRFSHAELESRLPTGVSPAYDGLTIAF
jgi:phosphoribosyl 1,2-cyclic phosphate phosphodiesterase